MKIQVKWSEEDTAYVATCDAFPSLSGMSTHRHIAIVELLEVMAFTLEDLDRAELEAWELAHFQEDSNGD